MRARLVVAMLLLLGMAGAGALALKAGWLEIPDDYNPWAELDATAPVNLLTPLKLRHARGDAARCFVALNQLGAQFARVPDRQAGPGCGFEDALRLSAIGAVKLQPPVVLSCRAALSFGMWERHSVQPAAQEHLRLAITSVHNLGSYACRDVNTGEPTVRGARRSRHATADAIDIAAFTRSGGSAITVDRDWARQDAVEQPGPAAFLKAVHMGACHFFDGVLGPDYNAVHRDHFHLEDGGWRMCR